MASPEMDAGAVPAPTHDSVFLSKPLFGLRLSYLLVIFSLLFFLLLSLSLLLLFLLLRRSRAAARARHVIAPIQAANHAEVEPMKRIEEGCSVAPPSTATTITTTTTVATTPTTASCSSSSRANMNVEREEMGWGRWYSVEELEMATGDFSENSVIGKGGYGIVYRGVLPDFSVVAVKNLLDNKGQAEREFKVEVEAIGKVRHKNLVGLIGYCAEGPKRMLVYEYVDNGSLEQWLHGELGRANPLTWDVRMKIAIGTAKGIAYLHEGLEPKVVHRDIKSSNILLDKQWNPKVSDFGMAKLLGGGSSYVTTRVMGTFGYVAPDYASTGILSEGSDIYSFGVLLMELISGRSPVDYNRQPGEVNLVEWFKGMVGSRRIEEVLDPSMPVQPPPRALKRVLLVCLRCIDSDAQKRPKMGQVVHMLEGDEFPFRVEHRSPRDTSLAASALTPRRVQLASGIVDLERSMWR
ncbi:Protein kinase superfamily protein [Rhynchospora pubera]|uniref:non-specific serine/threonine protein kinase n=1 Tax=Rhynchospora pubera TaxID=906938 RepID=A0AAV8HPI8_9POAL|nr:Protein kinase superfamily protein [Rhynchospora pubera]